MNSYDPLESSYQSEHHILAWLNSTYYDDDRKKYYVPWYYTRRREIFNPLINRMIVRGIMNEWILRKNMYQAYIQWLPREMMELLKEIIDHWVWNTLEDSVCIDHWVWNTLEDSV